MTSRENSSDGAEPEPPIRRSRSGCWTCRSRTVKKKCDQARPICGRCGRLKLPCDYSKRPTLAERRRAQHTSSPQEDGTPGNEATSRRAASPERPTSIAIIKSLDLPSENASSLSLKSSDHEAIRYFCTDFGKAHHIRHARFSLISLMFALASNEPMVMEMVLALGSQELNLRRPVRDPKIGHNSLQRYSSSLRRLADHISPNNAALHSDAIYTTLWMMLIWEQQFGDSECMAYTHHLRGIPAILRHAISSNAVVEKIPKSSKAPLGELSIYSARVLVWIAHLDVAAASFGIGGNVNTAILECLQGNQQGCQNPPAHAVKVFTNFHKNSVPLYQVTWGNEFPEDQVRDDAFSLLSACVQLRYQTANFSALLQSSPASIIEKSVELKAAIDHVGQDYKALLDIASTLAKAKDVGEPLRNSLLAAVPFYYAVLLDFMRIKNVSEPLGTIQRHALREMLNIITKSFEQGGDDAMKKLAWPLFIAVLETDDMIHQAWILERFRKISKFGRNFERAYQFLMEMIPLQQHLGQRIDLQKEMAGRPRFVLA